MRIDHKKWFTRLASFGMGICVVFLLGLIISIIISIIDREQIHYLPSLDTLVFLSKESLFTPWQWSIIDKLCTVIACGFIYAAFLHLNKFAALINVNEVFNRTTGNLLKRLTFLFFTGIIIRPVLLNILSFSDFLFSSHRVWAIDGAYLLPLLIVGLIAVFVFLMGDLLTQASQIKKENDLTI